MTISDIAKMAGVSSAAVSRYLNGGPLSEQKREAIRALRAAGRAIGTQVSLAGIGDSWVGGVVEPGLTTVRFYQKQVGVEAARMLLQMLEHPENGGPVRQTTLGYSVVDRGSIRIKEDA